MKNDEIARIALAGLLVVFLTIGIMFRKAISYIFCPLPAYTGKIYKGKSSYFLICHFILSLGFTLACYSLLNDIRMLSASFEDTATRLLTILILWVMWFYFIGLIIERYLQGTDKEYKAWKKDYLGK